jgi:hypothetical protein
VGRPFSQYTSRSVLSNVKRSSEESPAFFVSRFPSASNPYVAPGLAVMRLFAS